MSRILEVNPNNSTARRELEALCGSEQDNKVGGYRLPGGSPSRAFMPWRFMPTVN
jgi:hypothetical protein